MHATGFTGNLLRPDPRPVYPSIHDYQEIILYVMITLRTLLRFDIKEVLGEKDFFLMFLGFDVDVGLGISGVTVGDTGSGFEVGGMVVGLVDQVRG